MANTSKATYTFEELGAILMKRYLGRYTTIQSAKAALYPVAKALGISDINGKKNYKIVSKADGDKMLDYIELTRWNTKRQTPLERAARRTQRAAELSEELADKYSPKLEEVKEEADKPDKTEQIKTRIEKTLAENPQPVHIEPPQTLGEMLQIAINNAVGLAFETYLPGTLREIFETQFKEAYERGRRKGYEDGYDRAKAPSPKCEMTKPEPVVPHCAPPDRANTTSKWDI